MVILGPATQPAVPRKSTTTAPDGPADRLLRLAKLYLSNHRPEDARGKLKQILRDYPGTPAAGEAGRLLGELDRGS
jgi:TolA-binding protein